MTEVEVSFLTRHSMCFLFLSARVKPKVKCIS